LIRGELSDEAWEIITRFLPPQRGGVGRPPSDHRPFVNGMLWVLRTGAPWRDLPVEYGKWNSIYQRFARWSKRGVWDAILEAVANAGRADHSHHSLDSTVIRAHQHAAGAKGGLRKRPSVGRVAASRQRSTSGVKRKACRSSSR
jgi:transposase